MEYTGLILVILMLIAWKVFFPKYKIRLSSPIFRNTETKELGCWAHRDMNIPLSPFLGMIIHDGSGGIFKIREIQWDKSERILICNTYYDQPICKNEEQYEHIKKCATEFGWKLREVSSGHILGWWKEEYEA